MLTLDVRLLDGRYEAATTDKEVPEWPPHPARAFCALVAGARHDDEWAALRWLEQQPPPHVLAASTATFLRQSGYVVTNKRAGSGGSQFHPGRSNQLRTRVAAQPGSDLIRFEWSGAEPAEGVFAALDRLALRMPYLGRSTGHVISQFTSKPVPPDGLARFVPCALADANSVLRVPFEGYLDQLGQAYDEDRAAAELARDVGYAIKNADSTPTPTAESPFSEFVILRFVGVRPDGTLGPRLTAALRAALLARVPDPVPAVLHGHDIPGRPHVAFLSLPDVGHPHASGRLLGLAVALPSVDAAERRAIVRAAVAPDVSDHSWILNVPSFGAVELRYGSESHVPRGLTENWWVEPSCQWVSATPMSYDRYPKSDSGWIDEVVRSCVVAGYPEPEDVQISKEGLTAGATRLRKPDLPDRLRSRLLRHVRLRFSTHVQGPVLLGAGRYLGVGLFTRDGDQ